jgi:hypothetical protein
MLMLGVGVFYSIGVVLLLIFMSWFMIANINDPMDIVIQVIALFCLILAIFEIIFVGIKEVVNIINFLFDFIVKVRDNRWLSNSI